VHHSIHEIRHQCTDVLGKIGERAFATVPIRAIREACRRFHDDENMKFRFSTGTALMEPAPVSSELSGRFVRRSGSM
jgi:hypothetical protein